MTDNKQTPGRIVAFERNGKNVRATGIAELFGALVDSVYEKPETIRDAVALRDKAFKTVASELGLAAKQAKTLHDLLAFYADESEASGYGERYAILKNHYERFGPLPYQVVYYLLRCALSGSYKKIARKVAKESLKKHPKQTNRAAFVAWASGHITQGAVPRNLTDIKRLSGFNSAWGTDVTIRKWWKSIEGATKLQAGAPRT